MKRNLRALMPSEKQASQWGQSISEVNLLLLFKIQLFLEGHTNLVNCTHGFGIYYVNFKTIRRIAHIFVAFSEKLNFMQAI